MAKSDRTRRGAKKRSAGLSELDTRREARKRTITNEAARTIRFTCGGPDSLDSERECDEYPIQIMVKETVSRDTTLGTVLGYLEPFLDEYNGDHRIRITVEELVRETRPFPSDEPPKSDRPLGAA